MATENRTVDLTIDENTPFGMLLQFQDVDSSVYPPTEKPVDLTGFTLKGVIRDSLENNAALLATFVTSVVDAKQGVASISLTAADTTNLGTKASNTRDKFNQRLRFVGYYDIIMSRSGGVSPTSFRIIEGAVYISDGVTT
ncbi:hypothetical protein CPT_Slocum_168 [Serratia phage Slocum]|nr:hypothetical protein CPT_Slocum_168 [Serratia phage Slocum]URC22542.1 L-shaped tail fiber protein p132 [Serratia phage vB_SmaM-Kamaji]